MVQWIRGLVGRGGGSDMSCASQNTVE
jgi:hypothetical protein